MCVGGQICNQLGRRGKESVCLGVESYPKISRTQEKYSRYWKSQKGLGVLTDWICSLIAGQLLFSLYFSCLIPLQSEPPVIPTNWPSPSHGGWFFFTVSFLLGLPLTSEADVGTTAIPQSGMPGTTAHRSLLWSAADFLFSIGGLWNEAGATAHPCSQEILQLVEFCLQKSLAAA